MSLFTDISAATQVEALEELQKIAEFGQQKEAEGKQKSVKKSLTFLKGIISGLPSTIELVNTFGSVLPLVAKFFGLP